MGTRNRFLNFFQTFAVFLPIWFILTLSAVKAQVAEGADVNVSQLMGDQEECAIAKDPTNERQLFSLCNNDTGLFASRSTDGGVTWTYPDSDDKAIADGDVGQGPQACCDPSLAWDRFGNLFITYLGSSRNIVTIVSIDGGVTFSNLANWGPASVDQPTVVAANTSAPGAPVAVWIVWNQSDEMVARGAAVTGLGTFGAFGALQKIPGTLGCSFGDIAIAPTGAVVQACQNPRAGDGPATIFVNTDADGLGPANFDDAVPASTTNVGGSDRIPAQHRRGIDAEAGLAFDRNSASPHFGRLYLIYTEETANENNDTDIMLRYSDDDGAQWSMPPIRVNDDPDAPIRSQFMPKISTDPLSGNIGVCWYDARNSETNTAMQAFCAIATPKGETPTFLANARIGDGSSTSKTFRDFGDYSGLDYFQGLAHPMWADTSNSTGNNPNVRAKVDAQTDRVSGGTMAGDELLPPHVIVDNEQGSPTVVEPRSQTVLTPCNDTIPPPPWLSRPQNRNPSPEDSQEIMDLIHSYFWALDDREEERFGDLFTNNAVYEACRNGGAPDSRSQIFRTMSKAELQERIAEQFRELEGEVIQTRHFPTNTILNAVDENTVEEKTTMLVTIQRANTSTPENDYTAVLKGKLTKDKDGVWKFEKLTLFTDEPQIVSKAR
jgi:ketosteroid isomerase-like protein